MSLPGSFYSGDDDMITSDSDFVPPQTESELDGKNAQ